MLTLCDFSLDSLIIKEWNHRAYLTSDCRYNVKYTDEFFDEEGIMMLRGDRN